MHLCFSVGCWWVVDEVDTRSAAASVHVVQLWAMPVLHPVQHPRCFLKSLGAKSQVCGYTICVHIQENKPLEGFALYKMCTSGLPLQLLTFNVAVTIIIRNFFKNTIPRWLSSLNLRQSSHFFNVLPPSVEFCFDELLFTVEELAFCKAKNLIHFLFFRQSFKTYSFLILFAICFVTTDWLIIPFPTVISLCRTMEKSRRSTSLMWSKRAQRRLMPLSLNCSKSWDRDHLAR